MADKPEWRSPSTAFAYLNWCEDSKDVTGPARAVFWALAKRIDYRTGQRHMYLQDIMDRAGIRSRKTCARAVGELCERGILEVKDGNKLPGQTKPAPKLYRLILPEGYGHERHIAMGTRATYQGVRETHSHEEQSLPSSDAMSRDDLDVDVECPKGLEDMCMWSEFMPGREACVVCGQERRID